jgi:hypothetical protein
MFAAPAAHARRAFVPARALPRAGWDLAVLFSNIVGQLRVRTGADGADDGRLAAMRSTVRRVTATHSWASFHDHVSGAFPPEVDPVVHTSARLDDAAVVSRFYPDLAERAGTAGERDELLDHLTEGFFPAERPHAYFSWELMPGVFHLIAATCGVRSETDEPVVRQE